MPKDIFIFWCIIIIIIIIIISDNSKNIFSKYVSDAFVCVLFSFR